MGTRPVNRQTDMTENITFPKLRIRALIMKIEFYGILEKGTACNFHQGEAGK